MTIHSPLSNYCLAHLSGAKALQNYHSIVEWEAAAPHVWIFYVPGFVWAVACFVRSKYRKPRSNEKLKLKRHEIVLRCAAAVLALWALSDTALHLVLPYLAVTNKTLSFARSYVLPPKERADFDFLAALPIWHGVKLQTLLTHAELANYNRQLINWQVNETNYQNYVLCPVITGKPGEQLNWRKALWEEFYPRIRHENTPTDAAVIVVRHLRERVTIDASLNPHGGVTTIWLRQITDETGFNTIYIAALRSIGVPARLDPKHQAEFFDGTGWKIAPAPAVVSWLTQSVELAK